MSAARTGVATRADTLPNAVRLRDAADAVRATITAAARAGSSAARISLYPDTLGGLRISLTQTSQGLLARVAADHPEALQALQQSAGELRQSLEQSGLTVLRLEIDGSGAQQAGGSGAHASGSGGHGSAGSGDGRDERRDGANRDEPLDSVVPSSPATAGHRNGSLVNVLV